MSGGGGSSTLWGQGDARIRLGVIAESEFLGSLQSEQALALDATAESVVSFEAEVSHPMALSAEGASTPVSGLFGSEGAFTVFTEPFWGTIWEGGAVESDTLIENYQHSETPVKYIRLDDITLEYTGPRLTRVTKEEGDEKILEYSGNQLIRVTDNYNGIIKNLSYSGNQLTGVTVSKIV